VKNVDNMKMQLLLNHIQLQLTAVSDHNEIVEAKKDLLDFEITKLKQDNLLLQVIMYCFSFFFSFLSLFPSLLSHRSELKIFRVLHRMVIVEKRHNKIHQ
jgi:hypothetical protein